MVSTTPAAASLGNKTLILEPILADCFGKAERLTI
jgi:hypothetical protein